MGQELEKIWQHWVGPLEKRVGTQLLETAWRRLRRWRHPWTKLEKIGQTVHFARLRVRKDTYEKLTSTRCLISVYLMVKTEEIILINIHNENFPRVDHKWIFPPTAVGAKEHVQISKNRKRRHKRTKEHKTQFRFHRARIIYKKHGYLFIQHLLGNLTWKEINYFKLVAMKAYLNWFLGRNSAESL